MRRASARLYLSKQELYALRDWHTQEAQNLEDGLDDMDSPEPDEIEAIQSDIADHRKRADDLHVRADDLLDEPPSA